MSKTIHVKDQYRTNPLSLIPGGHTVEVSYSDGITLCYNRIKSPRKYIDQLKERTEGRTIVSVRVDGESFAF
jgi:hypothetical protein